jgi:hypothetical protein
MSSSNLPCHPARLTQPFKGRESKPGHARRLLCAAVNGARSPRQSSGFGGLLGIYGSPRGQPYCFCVPGGREHGTDNSVRACSGPAGLIPGVLPAGRRRRTGGLCTGRTREVARASRGAARSSFALSGRERPSLTEILLDNYYPSCSIWFMPCKSKFQIAP